MKHKTAKFADLEAQVEALTKERNELRNELKAAHAHAGKLEAANKAIANRLESAINSIKSVLRTS